MKDMKNLLIKYSESYSHDGQGDWTFCIRDGGLEAITTAIEQLEPEGEVSADLQLERTKLWDGFTDETGKNFTDKDAYTYYTDWLEQKYIKNLTPQQPSEGEITPQQQDLKFVEELYKDGFLSPKGRETWIKKINNE